MIPTLDRSYLFVPGNRADRFDKALAVGADALILDLEDAVPPSEKGSARDAIANWLRPEHRVIVRINGVGTEWFADDLNLLNHPGIARVILPKAEQSDDIRVVQSARSELPVLPLIESAKGVDAIGDIVATSGVERLVFGSIDLQVDLGMQVEDEELLFFRSMIVLASRLGGLCAPVDGVCTALDDESRLRVETMRARRLGFGGKLCIHPRQVAVVANCFAPTDADIQWARRVVGADANSGGAAVRLDNKMVDRPVVLQAMAILKEVEAKPQ